MGRRNDLSYVSWGPACTQSLELTFAPLRSPFRATGASAGVSLCILPGQDFSKLPSGAPNLYHGLPKNCRGSTAAAPQPEGFQNPWCREKLRWARLEKGGILYSPDNSVNTTSEGCRPNSSLKLFLTF